MNQPKPCPFQVPKFQVGQRVHVRCDEAGEPPFFEAFVYSVDVDKHGNASYGVEEPNGRTDGYTESWLSPHPESRSTNWQTIESAPRDGTEVLLWSAPRHCQPARILVCHYMPGGFCIEDHPSIEAGWYFWDGRGFDKSYQPTHWMPLPDQPKDGKGQEPISSDSASGARSNN